MCVQFVVQSSVQYSHELYKSQVRKKIKELAKKIHFKVYHGTNQCILSLPFPSINYVTPYNIILCVLAFHKVWISNIAFEN